MFSPPRPLVLVSLCLLLIIFYFDSYYIAQSGSERIMGSCVTIEIERDIVGAIIWFIISIIPICIIERCRNRSYIFKIFALGVFGMAVAIPLINKVSISDYIILDVQSELVNVILLSFMVSTNIYQLISVYQQIRIQYSWINGNHKKFSEYKYLEWCGYCSIHIIVYFKCFLWSNKCTIASVFATFHIVSVFIMVILYYALPRNNKSAECDLYHYRFLFDICIIMHLLQQTYCIIYSYLLQDYLINDDLHFILIYSISAVMHIIDLGLPKWILDKQQHNKFNIICAQKTNIHKSWLQYISSNPANFMNFGLYLIDNQVYQNMLFMIEVNQYKHVLLNRLKKRLSSDDNCIYFKVDMDPSYLVNWINNADILDITQDKVTDDMRILYEKYISKYFDTKDEYNELFVTFVSLEDKLKIEKKFMGELTEFAVLNIFDDVIDKTNNILQLLYRQYVKQNLA